MQDEILSMLLLNQVALTVLSKHLYFEINPIENNWTPK